MTMMITDRKMIILFAVLQWLFIVCTIFAGLYEQRLLSEDDLLALMQLSPNELPQAKHYLMLIAGILMVINFVSTIAICFLKPWARALYLLSFVLVLLVVLIVNMPFVYMPLEGVFNFLTSISQGVFLTLIFIHKHENPLS